MAKEPKSIREFLARVSPYHSRLHLIELFGSYARGTSRPDSDIDLLVVLKDNNIRDKVLEAADAAMSATGYKELLSPIIMDRRHFDKLKKKDSDFYYFVNKEGKTLWQTSN